MADATAVIATQACICGIHKDKLPSKPQCLVGNLSPELAPALVKYALVQHRFRPDIPAGGIKCALGRLRHILHLQIFHDDNSVVLADVGGELVQKILSHIGYLTM